MNPFHLAIPVKNLTISRKFYKEVLECEEGRNYKRLRRIKINPLEQVA
jgi:extradiol dioxygenase family protein